MTSRELEEIDAPFEAKIRIMKIIKFIIPYFFAVSLIGHANEPNFNPFGMELGANRTSEVNRYFPLSFILNNSVAWFSMHEVELSNLPPDDFYGRSDLISFVVLVDGIETIFSAHLIYNNYEISELLRDLSIKYDCEMLPIDQMGKNSGNCVIGSKSVMAYKDNDSGYAHVRLFAERPEAGKKPSEN